MSGVMMMMMMELGYSRSGSLRGCLEALHPLGLVALIQMVHGGVIKAVSCWAMTDTVM